MSASLDWLFAALIPARCASLAEEVFFPPPHFERKDEKLEREQRAKAICTACAVKEDCLSYSMQIREQHGIWGGLNENERKALLADRETVRAR